MMIMDHGAGSFFTRLQLIVAFFTGPRKLYFADKLTELTSKFFSTFSFFATDGLKFYPELF